MSFKTLINPLRQPTIWTCFHTCLIMLDRYRSEKSGIFHHPTELEEMVFPPLQKSFFLEAVREISEKFADPQANDYLIRRGSGKETYSGLHSYLSRIYGPNQSPTGFLTQNQARELAKLMNFRSSINDVTLAAFTQTLCARGPFIWIGRHEQAGAECHAVLVTGLVQRGNNHYVCINDPWDGLTKEEEFYDFVTTKRIPFMTVLGTSLKNEVFHV